MKKSASANECGNCGQPETKSGSMNVCGRCHRVRYCDRACQAAHWKGGHKTACVDPKACNPKDQPKEDRSAEVKCLICLGTKGSTYEHACRARLHPGCLADLYKHSRKELPPCPACRAPLPSIDDILKQFSAKDQYEDCIELLQGLTVDLWKQVASDIVYYQARHLNKTGRLDESVAKYQEFLKFKGLHPIELANAHHHIGIVYGFRRKYVLAENEYRAAVMLFPLDPLHHYHLGGVLTNQMDTIMEKHHQMPSLEWTSMYKEMSPLATAAIAAYDQCIELDPTHHKAYRYRAYCYYVLRNFAAALSDTKECIRICPEWEEGFLMCGRVLTDMQKFAEAQDSLLAGIKLNPTAPGYGLLMNMYQSWCEFEGKNGRPYEYLLQKTLKTRAVYLKMNLAESAC